MDLDSGLSQLQVQQPYSEPPSPQSPPVWISQLETGAKEFLPVEQVARGVTSPTYLDTNPLALNLEHAYTGFPKDPKWAEGGALLLTKLFAQNRSRPVFAWQ